MLNSKIPFQPKKDRNLIAVATPELEGWFKLEAVRPDGSRRVVADWFRNLILDDGLDRIGQGAWITGCAVGTGNSTPVPTQSSLDALLAWTTTKYSTASGLSGSTYTYTNVTYRFASGIAAGNLSEVGVGWGSTTMFSRALILDGNGAPTTITVLPGEILDVTYQQRLYIPTEDVVSIVTIDSTDYTVTVRPANGSSGSINLNGWYGLTKHDQAAAEFPYYWDDPDYDRYWFIDGALGSRMAFPTVTSYSYSFGYDVVRYAYVSGTYTRSARISAAYDKCNFSGGIGVLAISLNGTGVSPTGAFGGAWQIGFTPALPKDNTKALIVDVSFSWARRA